MPLVQQNPEETETVTATHRLSETLPLTNSTQIAQVKKARRLSWCTVLNVLLVIGLLLLINDGIRWMRQNDEMSSPTALEQKAEKLHVGMSAKQVHDLLGQPPAFDGYTQERYTVSGGTLSLYYRYPGEKILGKWDWVYEPRH